jgi:hypothetical protein
LSGERAKARPETRDEVRVHDYARGPLRSAITPVPQPMGKANMTLRSFRLSLLILSLATVVSLGRSAYPAGNATETFKGPGPWIDVTDPAFGAKGDGVTDDWRAIQNALDAAAAPVCATVALTCTSTNAFVVSQTLTVPSCVKFRGACGGGPGITQAPIKIFGSTLKWAPLTPPSAPTPVVLYQGVAHSSQQEMGVDCQNIAFTVGTRYNAEFGTPPSSFNDFDHLIWSGCHIGFVVGELSDNAVPPQDCVQIKGYPPPPNPLPPGCYEADQFRLEHFIVFGTGGVYFSA